MWSARPAFFLLSLLFSLTAPAADTYPTKPVRFIITFPGGGSTDVIVRLIGQRLTDAWGRPMIIDNLGGAVHVPYKGEAPAITDLIAGQGKKVIRSAGIKPD